MPEPRAPRRPWTSSILLPGDRVVLVRRKYPPPGWALPGGFVDVGETLEAAAVREAKRGDRARGDARRPPLRLLRPAPRPAPAHRQRRCSSAARTATPAGADDADEARAFALGRPPLPARVRPRRDPARRPPASSSPGRGDGHDRPLRHRARRAARHRPRRGARPSRRSRPRPRCPPSGPLAEPRGAFVTLHVAGELRGCIGTFRPRRLARRRRWRGWRSPRRARTRASRRSRADEIAELGVAVSVLAPPHRARRSAAR